MKFYLGLQKERPRYGGVQLRRKVRSSGLVWGTLIMAVTGFVLWFPKTPPRLLAPPWIQTVPRAIIHYYEALLAPWPSVILARLAHHLHPERVPP